MKFSFSDYIWAVFLGSAVGDSYKAVFLENSCDVTTKK